MLKLVVFPPLHQMSDYDSEADTDEYEPPEPTWRWLEADEFMETEYMPEEIMQVEADDLPNATWKPYPTVLAEKDRKREQRMIIVFTIVITLCAIVLGLQSAFNCTCSLNF